MTALEYRPAVASDAAECVELRGKTRENAVPASRLEALGITVESWGNDIRAGRVPGHVCVDRGRIVGYCFGDRRSGEIVVLAILPTHEGRGIGRALLSRMVQELRSAGFKRLHLGCSSNPAHRSYGFYRHLGWRSTGTRDERNDEILELKIQHGAMITHRGGCHCGRVRFEVTAPANIQVSECNCSMCSKSGYLHLVVSADRFNLVSGQEVLTTYTFNTGTARHLFCPICGIKSFYVPRSHPDGFSVNARCLDAGTVADMAVDQVNGREWEKHYPKGRGDYK